MSILFMGGEIGAFVPADASTIESTSSLTFNPAFARCSIGVGGSSSYAESVHWTETADCWLHTDIYVQKFDLNGPETDFIVAYNAADTAVYKVTLSGNPQHTVRQYYRSGSVWVQAGASFNGSGSTLNTVDMHIKCSSSGAVTLYFSGTQRASASANLAALSGVSYVRLRGSLNTYYSQFIAADEPTVGMRCGTIYPSGNGFSTDFTGDYTAVDEISYNDVDEITSGTAAQIELYTGTTVPTFTGYTIRAVAITDRAKTSGASAPTQQQLALRASSTTYFSSTLGLDAGYGAFCNVWNTNPATSAAFVSSDFASLQYGLKSIA